MSSTRPTISFGWYVVAASFVIMFLNAGARLMIGVLVKPMIADFGWSRSAVSAAVFVNMAVFSVAIIVAGRLYDRYGPKRIILVSSLLFSGGLMLMAVMTSLWQFVLFYGVISAAGLGGTTSPIFGAIVSRWFERKRGSAISLAMSGTSLGQFALVPLFTAFLLDEGWRSTMLWVGVLCLVVNVVLVFWVLRGDPKELGKEPYGHAEVAAAAAPAASGAPAAAPEPRSLGLREAMRTGSFWLFAVAMFVCGAGDFLLTTHLVPMATDHGVPTSTAVAMLAWFGLMSLGGILLAGPASDLIGDRIPMALAFGLRVVLFLVIVRYQNAAAFWVAVAGVRVHVPDHGAADDDPHGAPVRVRQHRPARRLHHHRSTTSAAASGPTSAARCTTRPAATPSPWRSRRRPRRWRWCARCSSRRSATSRRTSGAGAQAAEDARLGEAQLAGAVDSVQ